MEPQFRDRAWETLGPFACGQAAWILEEHRRVLCQLAKLKYNRVVLAFAPWQPFVHYEFREVSRTVAAMTKCYDLLEQATDVICENDPTIVFPMPGMVMAHYTSADPPPGWWKEAKTLYLQSLSEEGRAIERTEIRGKPYLLFLIKRLVLGFSHFGTLESLRESGIAGREQDLETAIEKFEAALESVYGSAHALASQARYRSDLGTIAILNAYGYHPLLEELQTLYEAEEDLEEP